jgi:transcriptional regulator with XRE-family HTH domain
VTAEEPRRGRRPGEQTRVETKLAAWRVKRGMTQQELAEVVGLPLSTYRLYERGKMADPGVITLKRFAYVLGCKLADLIEDDWDWHYQRRIVAGSRKAGPKPPDPKALWRPRE